MFINVNQVKKIFEGSCHSRFSKKYAKSEKYTSFHFFLYKILVFALKHISITNQEIMQNILFDFPFSQSEVLFFSLLGIQTYAKFQAFLTLSMVDKTGIKMVIFGLGPILNCLRSTKVGQIYLKTILTQTKLPKLLQQSVLASLNFGLLR